MGRLYRAGRLTGTDVCQTRVPSKVSSRTVTCSEIALNMSLVIHNSTLPSSLDRNEASTGENTRLR